MKLNVMFIIAAIGLTLIGILSFLAPLAPAAALGTTDANAGWQSMLGGRLFCRLALSPGWFGMQRPRKPVTRSSWVTLWCLP